MKREKYGNRGDLRPETSVRRAAPSGGQTVSRIFNGLVLAGSLLILVSLSFDIMFERQYYLGAGFLHLQLAVCLIFMADFFVRLATAPCKQHYVARNWILLLVSVPLLNLMEWFGVELSRSLYIVFKAAPLVRGFYGMLILIGFTRDRVRSLFYAYLFTVAGFTYFSALIFYSFEHGPNPKLDSFGDALWWACMNVTTVGAEIFAVTTIGKILSVVLPGLGMLMLPVFTVYVTDRFKRTRSAGK